MAGTRLSVSLAHLVLGFVFAAPVIGVTSGEPLAARRLGLRSAQSPTRRSADTHFLRFGRSGGDGVSASAAPTPSLTCVPDATSDGRVVCYSPSNVSRHFLLVTERRDDHDRVTNEEQLLRAKDEDEEEEDDDVNDDQEEEAEPARDEQKWSDDDAVDQPAHEARNQTARPSRTRGSGKRRFGRSTASGVDGTDAFARFGRRRDNFMRLGRADVNEHESNSREHGGGPNSQPDYDATSAADKRGPQSFIRFGRENWRSASDDADDDDDDGGDGVGDQRTTDDESRHQRETFARLGRRGPSNMNQLRFGRSDDRIGARTTRRHDNFMRLGRGGGGGGGGGDHKPLFGRAARRHDNFMRLGRGGGDFDLDMFRETRRRDSFLRLGRGGGSRICGLPVDSLTPRLVRHLLDERRHPAANHSTASDDGPASNAYYDSMVECLRRYVRPTTTAAAAAAADSLSHRRTHPRPISTTSIAGAGDDSSNRPRSRSGDDDDDVDVDVDSDSDSDSDEGVYLIATATGFDPPINA